ncbi:hypothetical protein GCM10010276_11190 [Streptomyces longisporus]|uniref:Uncharacterized protein n=1 Tax=Streptomyces longisporus TaxID=1948 RepID=A0ABN3L371_STRLO
MAETLVNTTTAAPVPVPAGRSAAWCAVTFRAVAAQVFTAVPVEPDPDMGDAFAVGAFEVGAWEGSWVVAPGVEAEADGALLGAFDDVSAAALEPPA